MDLVFVHTAHWLRWKKSIGKQVVKLTCFQCSRHFVIIFRQNLRHPRRFISRHSKTHCRFGNRYAHLQTIHFDLFFPDRIYMFKLLEWHMKTIVICERYFRLAKFNINAHILYGNTTHFERCRCRCQYRKTENTNLEPRSNTNCNNVTIYREKKPHDVAAINLKIVTFYWPNWCFQLVSHAWKVRIIGMRASEHRKSIRLEMASPQNQNEQNVMYLERRNKRDILSLDSNPFIQNSIEMMDDFYSLSQCKLLDSDALNAHWMNDPVKSLPNELRHLLRFIECFFSIWKKKKNTYISVGKTEIAQ